MPKRADLRVRNLALSQIRCIMCDGALGSVQGGKASDDREGRVNRPRYERVRDRLQEIEHDPPPAWAKCAGLAGGCPDCIALYRELTGDERPTCVLCTGQHFAYEPHWAPDVLAAELRLEEPDA